MAPDGNFTRRKKIWWSLVLPLMPPPIIWHFVVLMLGLGFGQSSQCPRRLHHHKWSSLAGSRFLPSFQPGAALCDGRKVTENFTLLSLCLQVPHCLKDLISSSLPCLWRTDAKLTSWWSFAQWSSSLYLFSSLSLPLYMIFVFGKLLQISLVVFFNITVIIAYIANYTKSDLMEVIY